LVYLPTRVVQPIGWKKKVNPETAARAARAGHIFVVLRGKARTKLAQIQYTWHQTWLAFEVHSECILLVWALNTH